MRKRQLFIWRFSRIETIRQAFQIHSSRKSPGAGCLAAGSMSGGTFSGSLGEHDISFVTELAAPVRYLVCQPTLQLTKLIFKKNIHLVYLDWMYLLLPSGKSSGRTCNPHANFGVAKLSSSLIPCLKNQNLFSIVSLCPLYPKGLLQYRRGKVYLNISTQTKSNVSFF